MRSGSLRSSSPVIGGSVAAQLCFFAATPILTRQYSPTAFGIAGAFSAALAVIGTMCTGRFHVAIPIPENVGAARGLLRLSLVTTIPVAAVAALATAGFVGLAGTGGWPANLQLGLAVGMGVGVLLVGTNFSVHAMLSRLTEFGGVGASKAAQGLAYTAGALALGVTGSASGLIAAQLAGQAAAAGAAVAVLQRRRSRWRSKPPARLKPLLAEYRSYPTFSAPAALLNSAGVNAPLLLVPVLYSSYEAGLYALSYRLLLGPAVLVAMALSTVFLSAAPGAHREGRLLDEAVQTSSSMLRIALPAAAAVIIAGPVFVAVVLGPEWTGLGRLLQLLTPYFLTTLTVAPLMPCFAVLGRLRLEMTFQASMAIGRVLSLLVGSLIGSLEVGVLGASVVTLAHFLWFALWLRRGLRAERTTIAAWRPVKLTAARCTVALAMAFVGALLLSGYPERLFLGGIALGLLVFELGVSEESRRVATRFAGIARPTTN